MIVFIGGLCIANLFYRKTQVGNIEVTDIRPPRFIGRDGVGYNSSLMDFHHSYVVIHSCIDCSTVLAHESCWECLVSDELNYI